MDSFRFSEGNLTIAAIMDNKCRRNSFFNKLDKVQVGRMGSYASPDFL
jgi:hypothetical protein